jgi:hypothetical protein
MRRGKERRVPVRRAIAVVAAAVLVAAAVVWTGAGTALADVIWL